MRVNEHPAIEPGFWRYVDVRDAATVARLEEPKLRSVSMEPTAALGAGAVFLLVPAPLWEGPATGRVVFRRFFACVLADYLAMPPPAPSDRS